MATLSLQRIRIGFHCWPVHTNIIMNLSRVSKCTVHEAVAASAFPSFAFAGLVIVTSTTREDTFTGNPGQTQATNNKIATMLLN